MSDTPKIPDELVRPDDVDGYPFDNAKVHYVNPDDGEQDIDQMWDTEYEDEVDDEDED